MIGAWSSPVLSLVQPAQKRASSCDYLALPNVGGPQLSPDGKWIVYTVTTYSVPDNRGTSRVWLADVVTGKTRPLTQGAGTDRQPRWSPDGGSVAFVSTRQGGAQLWVLSLAGGEARQVTSLADGVFDPVWLPDGKGLLVNSDIKWPTEQEIDRRKRRRPHGGACDRAVLRQLGPIGGQENGNICFS